MNIFEDFIFDKIFSFICKALKLIGAFISYPFIKNKYSLEEMSEKTISGIIGLIFLAIVFFIIWCLK